LNPAVSPTTPIAASLPLVAGAADRILALQGDRTVTVGEFLAEAHRLAARLPDRPYLINLCDSRYRFAVALVAAMLRGQITLLPANRAPKALERLSELYPGAYRWSDEHFEADSNQSPELPEQADFNIPADRTVAIVFTSGSTGDPQPHLKTWGIYSESARLIAQSLGIGRFGEDALIATVPPQHMYGLELSVLLPLCWGGRLYDGKPFFPADVADALEKTRGRRFLVTTPVHLRACVESAAGFPSIEGLVSATAPLSGALAAASEQVFGCTVQEIYGCSEAGSVARRRTVEGDVWQSFPGIRVSQGLIRADFLPEPVPIQDVVEPLEQGRFRLLGRESDLINIAGKRTSLSALNHVLLDIEGVSDGAFFTLEEGQNRLMAAVVAPGVARERILEGLQARVDPVFLPRPLYFVDVLPRSDTGKLTRKALIELLAELRARAAHE
jgi:acyl-coenzyme A synthetase/AMP-(fatty) acid ligase